MSDGVERWHMMENIAREERMNSPFGKDQEGSRQDKGRTRG